MSLPFTSLRHSSGVMPGVVAPMGRPMASVAMELVRPSALVRFVAFVDWVNAAVDANVFAVAVSVWLCIDSGFDTSLSVSVRACDDVATTLPGVVTVEDCRGLVRDWSSPPASYVKLNASLAGFV